MPTEIRQTRKPKERRVAARPRPTISQIIENMEAEADLLYQGNLQDNALKIFNSMAVDDRRTFLRNAITVLWERRIELSLRGQVDIVIDDETRFDPYAIQQEREKIAQQDYEDQMRLRSFILQVMFVASLIMFFSVLFFSYSYGSTSLSGEDISDFVKNTSKVMELLLSFK